jgi:hypothetical protein
MTFFQVYLLLAFNMDEGAPGYAHEIENKNNSWKKHPFLYRFRKKLKNQSVNNPKGKEKYRCYPQFFVSRATVFFIWLWVSCGVFLMNTHYLYIYIYIYIHQVIATSILTWQQRMNISIGIARGLWYLHHNPLKKICHGDMKVIGY